MALAQMTNDPPRRFRCILRYRLKGAPAQRFMALPYTGLLSRPVRGYEPRRMHNPTSWQLGGYYTEEVVRAKLTEQLNSK